MIEIKKLTCKYQNEVILQDIDLDIDTHLSIIGSNGSGKSTFAKALCGLIDFGGEISIDSKNINSLRHIERAKLISYIPAKLEIYDSHVSVYEFVLLSRFAYKRDLFDYTQEDKEKTLKNIEFVGLAHLKEHTVGSLSSGEQQLCLIASALTQESKIIIFDEPTANLDPQNTKRVASIVKELKNSRQIILITHDLHLACYMDNKNIFIQKRSVKKFGRELFDNEVLKGLFGVEFNSLAVVYE
ncbi:ABC transporter ATP-binding protein [bacterium]|nr:ABC transporter ATP-binding protein [bacterium]MBU1883931.1 ABC transporter ATP-binding protein [bacterium]